MFFFEWKWGGELTFCDHAPSNTACAYTCRARRCSCGIQEAVFGLLDSHLENNEQQIWRVSKSFCGICGNNCIPQPGSEFSGVRKIHVN